MIRCILILLLSLHIPLSSNCQDYQKLSKYILCKKFDKVVGAEIDSILLIKELLELRRARKINTKYSRFTNYKFAEKFYRTSAKLNNSPPPTTNAIVSLFLVSAYYRNNVLFADMLTITQCNVDGNKTVDFVRYKRKNKKETKKVVVMEDQLNILEDIISIYNNWFIGLSKFSSLTEAKASGYPPPLQNSKYRWFKADPKIYDNGKKSKSR